MLPLGKVVATIGAIAAFGESLRDKPLSYLARHSTGDWGEVGEHDSKANEDALAHGLRVLSAYTLCTGEKIWVITESDRSSTCILLPREY